MGWPHPVAYDSEFRFKVPRALRDRAMLLATLRGERPRELLTRLVVAAVEEELRHFPVHVAWLRPGSVIYTQEGGVFVPMAKAVGGERVWPIQIVELYRWEKMPDADKRIGALGWQVDVTADGGGLDGLRGVYVRVVDVVGQERELGLSPGTHPLK